MKLTVDDSYEMSGQSQEYPILGGAVLDFPSILAVGSAHQPFISFLLELKSTVPDNHSDFRIHAPTVSA